MLDRLIGVDDPLLADLPIADRKSRVAFQRQPEHREAMPDRGVGLFLVGRRVGRDENNAVETVDFAGGLGGQQVPLMNRVERPAEQGNAHYSLICPVPCTTYLVVVSSRAP